jgi:hypothetical protein
VAAFGSFEKGTAAVGPQDKLAVLDPFDDRLQSASETFGQG